MGLGVLTDALAAAGYVVEANVNQEPVSGFEPLACRLQDGCSAC
jgi:hypothetical protein